MKIYRVCTLSKNDEHCEVSLGNLPGWRCSYTGFWTESEKDAEALLMDRHELASLVWNGASHSVLVETDIENVIVDKNHGKYKQGQESRYDDHELFVLKVHDESKITVLK